LPNSKLGIYLEIVKLLREHGPQNFSQINLRLKVIDPFFLKKSLDFLANNKMIIENITGNNQSFAIAEPGIYLLDFFNMKPIIKT
jgi:hypothetical protein